MGKGSGMDAFIGLVIAARKIRMNLILFMLLLFPILFLTLGALVVCGIIHGGSCRK